MKKTIGEISSALINKSDDRHTVVDQMRENLTDYDRDLMICAERGKKEYTGDFYIVVITKQEKIMRNVIRNYFLVRHSCPTPDNDQIVYRYEKGNSEIKFLWAIPNRHTVGYLIHNALLLPPEEKQLLDFVLKFKDGSLLRLSKQLNNEQPDSNILISRGTDGRTIKSRARSS
jgi:hypothetical protein